MSAILVATSQTAERNEAVDCGLALSRELDRRLVVLRVFDGAPDPRERERFAEAVSRWAKAGAYPASNRVSSGKEDLAIVEEARRTGSDIIVLGPHRSNLLDDIFGKSMVEDVLEDTDRMVLVAGPGQHRFRNILVLIDCSQPSARAAKAAHRLFPEATISFLRPWHVPYEGLLSGSQSRDSFETQVKKETADFLNQLHLGEGREGWQLGELLVREGDTVYLVRKCTSEFDIDLLVLGVEGSAGMLSSALDPTSRSLLEDPPSDVLAVQCRH